MSAEAEVVVVTTTTEHLIENVITTVVGDGPVITVDTIVDDGTAVSVISDIVVEAFLVDTEVVVTPVEEGQVVIQPVLLGGPQGPPGPPGPQGEPGGSSTTFDYSFNDTTTAPPGGGQVRLNHADQTLATKVWISKVTAPGVDVGNLLAIHADATQVLYIQDKDNSTRWQSYPHAPQPITPIWARSGPAGL